MHSYGPGGSSFLLSALQSFDRLRWRSATVASLAQLYRVTPTKLMVVPVGAGAAGAGGSNSSFQIANSTAHALPFRLVSASHRLQVYKNEFSVPAFGTVEVPIVVRKSKDMHTTNGNGPARCGAHYCIGTIGVECTLNERFTTVDVFATCVTAAATLSAAALLPAGAPTMQGRTGLAHTHQINKTGNRPGANYRLPVLGNDDAGD